MKNINLLLAGVLMCTLVSARGIDGPVKGSSVAVTNVFGSTLYKLYYKSEKAGKVKVAIFDEKGSRVFQESFSNVDGFVRPYNFQDLPEGKYTISIEDENGKVVEKVNYESGRVEKLIRVQKLADQNKYLLSIAAPKAEDVFIYIFDENDNLIHSEIRSIGKEFAQIYTLNGLRSFTIEVSDKFGVLKKITY